MTEDKAKLVAQKIKLIEDLKFSVNYLKASSANALILSSEQYVYRLCESIDIVGVKDGFIKLMEDSLQKLKTELTEL